MTTNWIDAHNTIIRLERRRAHLTRLIVANTSLANELASEHDMRADDMLASIHSHALHLNRLRDL